MSTTKKQNFWIVLVIIVIASGILYFMTYDHALPYIEHADEPNFYHRALKLREGELNLKAIPAFYHFLVAGIQIFAETILGLNEVGSIIRIVRFVSTVFSLTTLIFIALTARLAAGDEAGYLASVVWGASPLILTEGVYAMPDPLIALLVSIALWLAANALLDENRRVWAIWSVITGILIIETKFHPPTIIGLGAFVSLVWLIRDWRKNWLHFVIQSVLVSAMLLQYYLLQQTFLNDPVTLARGREGASFATGGFVNLVDLNRIRPNLQVALDAVNGTVLFVAVALGIAAYVVARWKNRDVIKLEVLGLSLFVLLSVPWIAAAFRVGWPRDVLGGVVGAAVIIGIAGGQVVQLIPEDWSNLSRTGLATLLAVPLIVPQIGELKTLVETRTKPDRRVEMREWFDVSLEPGTVLVDYHNHKTFNSLYGGIEGQVWFNWEQSGDITVKTPEEWQAAGVVYAILPLYHVNELQASPEGEQYLDTILELRKFDDLEKTAPEMVVYRLWDVEHEIDVRFGDTIHLVGFDDNRAEAVSSQELHLQFYWQAEQLPPQNYSLFVHLTPIDTLEPVAQTDGNPGPHNRLPMTWSISDETIISPLFKLSFPSDFQPGEYRVLIGLYNYENGERLPVSGVTGEFAPGDNAYELLTLALE